jgi:superfamily II DNA or RNA helicase
MQVEPHAPRAGAQSLAGRLRPEFKDVDVRLGDTYVAGVEGNIDPLGGATATVSDFGGSRRVQLMPSLHEDDVLLAACDCTPPGEPACNHLWAVIRAIDAQGSWPRDVRMPTEIEMTSPDDPDLELIADAAGVRIVGTPVRGDAMARPKPIPPPVRRSWRDLVHDWPSAPQPPAGKLAAVEYVLQATAIRALNEEQSRIIDDHACAVLVATLTGPRAGVARRKYASLDPSKLTAADLAIQTLLFGVEEMVDLGQRSGKRMLRPSPGKRFAARIAAPRVGEILARLAASGRFGWLPDESGVLAPLAWDAGGAWNLEVRIEPGPERGRARVTGALTRGTERVTEQAPSTEQSTEQSTDPSTEQSTGPSTGPSIERLDVGAITGVAGGGVAIAGDRAISVAVDGLGRWLQLLCQEVPLAMSEVPLFVERTCRTRRPPRLELGAVGIEIMEQAPACRVVLEPRGRAGFTASAELTYTGQPVDLAGPATLVRARGKQLVRRRLDDEHAWALAVRGLGGDLERGWTLAPAKLRELVEGAAAQGIEVFYAGAAVRSRSSFSANVESGIDWFDLSLAADATGARLEMPELLAALRTGRPLVRLSDGTTALIPSWLERRAAVLAAAPLAGDALRFRKAEALILAALLDGAPGAEVDATFARVRERLDQFVGMAPCDAPPGFGATLRDYQRDGLGWLHFLRELGLGGCLADDMGLGKTVQVLALLEHQRAEQARRRPRGTHKPSLVVAPRSLVFHWLDEARRFAPRLTTLEWHGEARAERAAELAHADLIVTTYATLRLDLEQLAAIPYAIVVLDEAHAIKTATTATAQAARALGADFRLALTGTPVENRLDDLASIFDYLNPGLLGRPAALRAISEAPVERIAEPSTGVVAGVPSSDAKQRELAHARALGKVLRPFMLRRTKEQVLTELPPKTEVVVTCRLDDVERRRYDDLRAFYRRSLLPAVERDGVGKSAILVLEALLRLRQAALHPGLLDAQKVGADSAKLDALVEHLGEAIASGHRALVFSQFTTLLGIVSARLQREGITHAYLDGKTRDRRERVAAFQRGTTPVFLLSLKAAGVGLNLTAADHVFLLDPWWNPAIEAQAIDRVHRIGQGRPVTAYRLVAEDTVEAKILALQAHKRALFDSVFEDTSMVANLSASDLRALLD